MSQTHLREVDERQRGPKHLTMRIFLEQALDGRFTSRSWNKIMRQTAAAIAAWPDLGSIGDPEPVLRRLRQLNVHGDLGRELLRIYDSTQPRGHIVFDELDGWTQVFALAITYAIYGEFERLGWADCMDRIEGLVAADLEGHSVRQYGIRKALCVLRFLEIYDDAERATCLLTLWLARGEILQTQLHQICDGLTTLRSTDPVEQLNRIPLEQHIGRLAGRMSA